MNKYTKCSYCERWQYWKLWLKRKPVKAIESVNEEGNVSRGICPECQKEIDEIIDALPNIIKSNN